MVSWTGKHEYFPVPVHACEFGLARRVRPSRSASACSFSTLRLNLALTHEFLPLSAAASIYLYRQRPSGQSRVYRVTQLRTDGVHCRAESFAGAGPVVLKAVRVTGDHHGPISMRLSFSHTHYWYVMDMMTCVVHQVSEAKTRSYARSKTKNGVFRSGFFDQKKSYLILRKAIYFFLIEKSRSKNAVFRFRSRIIAGLKYVIG